MSTVMTAGAAVARIAYAASDVVVSVQPSLAKDSEFSKHLRSLAASKAPSVIARSTPEILAVRHNADPLLAAFHPIQTGNITSVTTSSSILLQSIPRLYKLAQHPVVIHVALEPTQYPDYSQITSIRQSGFIFIQSDTLQEVQDLALTAHALALKTGKGVIHFFNSAAISLYSAVPVEDKDLVARLLNAGSVAQYQQASQRRAYTYVDDGTHATVADAGNQTSELEAPGAVKASPVLEAKDASATTSAPESSSGSSRRESETDSASTPASSVASYEPATTRPLTSEDIDKSLSDIWNTINEVTGRRYDAFEYLGSSTAQAALFVFGADPATFAHELEAAQSEDEYANTGILKVRVYRPWLASRLVAALPPSVKRIAVLEQVRRKTTRWGPLLLDLLASLKANGQSGPTVVGYQLGYLETATAKQALRGVFQNLLLDSPVQNLEVGRPEAPEASTPTADEQPALENPYTLILRQVFEDRLYIANQSQSSHAGISATVKASPEYGFGSLIARTERRQRFAKQVASAVKSNAFSSDAPQKILSQWAAVADDATKANAIAPEVLSSLKNDASTVAASLAEEAAFFSKESQWIIGSDAWAYDLGNSGVHHVLASGANVNMLIIDSQPYSERASADAARRKKDIGLYAMNFGNAYVASVAVYGSYTQVLESLIEAEQFNGPSIVVAYLPYNQEDDSPLVVLQETKKAIDSGYWPLYRWNPLAEEKGDERFSLDSEVLKKELEEFLRRDNYLTQMMKRNPEFHPNLASSYGAEVRDLQKRRAKDAYSKLLDGLAGAPLTILYASDNGNAENLSKRLGNRGKARGLKTIVMAMDDYPLEDLASEENVVFISATAGQGEFPQNGRQTWETIRNSTDFDLATVNFSVFALGDSHYWPRKEDRIYYNKPGKDLFAKLESFGGKTLCEIGLGDDQDPDTYQTGYSQWEPKLWQALGVDKVEGLPEEPPPLTNEDIKIDSNFLRGTIAEGLEDESTAAISAADQQLTKFHGTYMQDDRDLRDERKAAGLEPAYSFMIRCRLAGGIATPMQWIQMDDISNNLGNETMKLTTRQTFQFHGIVKKKLRPAMQAINQALMTTIAACGDVNRNVMCSSLPQHSEYHREVHAVSQKISDHLLPSTTAYHEIWLQDNDKKVQVAGDAVVDHEPLYGPTYLPRKFKITIAIPPHNDTDVYAHDIGLIAIKGKDGHLEGFNILAGGGMGVTHNMKKTYPQIGKMFGYVATKDAHIVCEKIMLVQRDHGDRKNRKHARLKYTIDDMGLDVYKGKVEELLGFKFEEPREFKFESNIDTFGWQKDEKGLNHFTFFIENGRIEDTADFPMKTGLRSLAKSLEGTKAEFRLTGNQHLMLSNVADGEMGDVKSLLAKYKLDNTNFSGLRLSSSACVAFPTCGLAMAESERYLPVLVTKVEKVLEAVGLRQDSIVMRMTGCPNGCARPWLAEVAFVGKAFGAYNMYLGGGYHGQRLNKLYRSSIMEDEIMEIMTEFIHRYAKERHEGERFGDWTIRAGIIVATKEGRDFHDNTAEVEEDE